MVGIVFATFDAPATSPGFVRVVVVCIKIIVENKWTKEGHKPWVLLVLFSET